MKTAWYNRKWVVVLLHAAAWALLFSLPALLTSSYNNREKPPEPHHVAHMVFGWLMNSTWICLFYLNALLLIPRFVYRKKYWQYMVLEVLLLILVIGGSSFLARWLIGWDDHFNLGKHVLFNFFVYLFFLSCSTTYQMVRDKLKADRIHTEKENENLKTELSLLRSQVSPHFMFNVLNNMVALARKHSELLEPSLIKLSSLMRYMLYEADEEKVSLEKETEYLHSYIDLQQQRFGNKVRVLVTSQSDSERYQIEPMLLIPFVENAFKHGTGMIENAEIQVDLAAEKNILRFSVRNKYDPMSVEVKDKTSGIGLANVKRRLNLLYGNHHNLMISDRDQWFVVSLQIHLN